ncbi:MAG: universal stress protein, partial [Gammaproteobacteria bacterium]
MTRKLERILIAVKPWQSQLPLSAARIAQLARNQEAKVALTSCVRLSALESGFVWAEPGTGQGLEETLENQADEELAQLEQLAQPLRDAGVTVTTTVRSGRSASDGILDEVAEWSADLLVAGVHEPRASLRPRLTEVYWQLMRMCPCPLLLTRASNGDPYRNILAAVDPLNEHAEPAGLDEAILSVARQCRDAFEADLRIVNVHPDPEEFEVVSSVEVRPGIFYGTENIEAVHRQALI